ncbi:hypothetical protein TNCV_3875811 [Trichonephila clavipes]|uniref:Uncharacterized protein n=1 Tax=Trichonephila clavipes TaxID=2585209 RepID=A0A8X6VR47_TRICX|nr:hypothetical protein TNCV_3875811 [Trichonephila clavipes]
MPVESIGYTRNIRKTTYAKAREKNRFGHISSSIGQYLKKQVFKVTTMHIVQAPGTVLGALFYFLRTKNLAMERLVIIFGTLCVISMTSSDSSVMFKIEFVASYCILATVEWQCQLFDCFRLC